MLCAWVGFLSLLFEKNSNTWRDIFNQKRRRERRNNLGTGSDESLTAQQLRHHQES